MREELKRMEVKTRRRKAWIFNMKLSYLTLDYYEKVLVGGDIYLMLYKWI